MKKIGLLAIFLVAFLAVSGLASALPAIETVKVNGEFYAANTVVERGEEIDIKLGLRATANESDVQVEADIYGYEYSDFEKVSDTSHNMDINAGDLKWVTLNLKVPQDMDKDYFDVRVRVGTKTGDSAESTYRIHVEGQRHLLEIKRFYLSPEEEVKAGRPLYAKVKVKNFGENTEDDVSVRVAIPELGVSEITPIDENIETDESVTSEELLLRVPSNAKTGDYKVKVTVYYDNDKESTSKEYTLHVVGSEDGEPVVDGEPVKKDEPLEVTIGAEDLQLTKGQSGGFYPITISNPGSEAKTVTVSADAVWADVRISPSNVVVVEGGDSKALYVYVSPKETAAEGEQLFGLEIKAGEEIKSVTLKANVASAATSGWDLVKKVLVVALVVLVVLVVIVGLVIVFNRMKTGEDEEEPDDLSDQTYY
ncbi:hypothetical protein KY330_01810 [Candidatus Woesearchaeota archaeon]|nr:hypothetical protein [Candidatus Woesearchaeota archaeon]